MKKVFVFTLICLALLLLVPGVVSGAEETPVATSNSAQSGQTVVTYGVQAKYMLVVPPNFNISTESAIHTGVRVSNGLLAEGTAVAVNVSSSFYNTSAVPGQAAWRMMLNGEDHSLTGKFISYHLHTATRVETDMDDNGNPIYSYTENDKIESGVPFMYAPATAFSRGDGEVVKYLSFRVEAASLADISLAGAYTDTLVFSAAIVPYSPAAVQ